MTNLPLFTAPTYRETSREAWRPFLPVSAHLDRLIMAVLELHCAEGATCQQIEACIDRDHQAVSGNLRHLVERGLVKPTKLRGLTRSGRKAIRWVTAGHYDPALHEDASA